MTVFERTPNDAGSTLSGAVTSVATSFDVVSATDFPTEGVFRIIINSEIMLVTSVSGDTFTVTRGVDGTSAAAHLDADQVAAIMTRDGLNRILTERLAPMAPERPPFRIADSSGNLLTQSDFTKVTASGATFTDNAGGSIAIRWLQPDTTNRFIRMIRPAPTPPYTIVGAMQLTQAPVDLGAIWGPILHHDSNVDSIHYRWRPMEILDFRLRANHYTTETNFTAIDTLLRAEPSPSAILWFKIEDDNTDIKYHISSDGVNFIEWLSKPRAIFAGSNAPTHIGMGLINFDENVHEAVGTLLAWQE